MKKIEFLFPDLCHLYAEGFNVEYLKKCSDEIEIVETLNFEEPLFAREDVDMIYIGAMSETKQELALKRLMPYRDRIRALIEAGTVFLVTGNAPELFGSFIEDNGRKIPALGLFPFHGVRIPGLNRHNSQFLGEFDGVSMLGHKSQFSFAYPDDPSAGPDIQPAFIRIGKGVGMNPDSTWEGLHYKNFFATYSLGPFLILNPDFDKKLLGLLGLPERLAFEKEIYEATEYRRDKLSAALK